MADINFWAHRLGKQNGLPINDAGSETHVTVHTDASDVGWGAHLDGETNRKVHGRATPVGAGTELNGEGNHGDR